MLRFEYSECLLLGLLDSDECHAKKLNTSIRLHVSVSFFFSYYVKPSCCFCLNYMQEELRSSIISVVKQSAALNRPGAENLKPRQLSDAIFEEIK